MVKLVGIVIIDERWQNGHGFQSCRM